MEKNKEKIMVLVIALTAGIITGSVLYLNYVEQQEVELDFYQDETVYEVNETNDYQTVEFENYSTSIWMEDEDVYLDLTGDGSLESQVENLTRDGEEHAFVKSFVQEGNAYQLYYRYRIGEDVESNYIQLYRIREI